MCFLQSQKLLSHLAEVYVATSGDVKRTILRIIEVGQAQIASFAMLWIGIRIRFLPEVLLLLMF
jgi:hypothetical protein